MRYTELDVAGVLLVEMEPRHDDRGFFARAYAGDELEFRGLSPHVAQANLSFNHRAGTLRGLHLSLPGHPEAKFVRCVRGAIADVAVDLRPDSPTYLQHAVVELSAENRTALYLPAHVGHGYQTLTDDAEVLYLVSVPYASGAEVGYRFDDPAFGVQWPRPVTVLSDKDGAWPTFDRAGHEAAFAAGAPAPQ